MTAKQEAAPEGLKPCPFCGTHGEKLIVAFTSATDTFAYWSVECPGCGVEVGDDASEGAAITAWNARTPAEQPDAALVERDDFYAARYAERCGEVLRLREALKPFARIAASVLSEDRRKDRHDDKPWVYRSDHTTITYGDLRRTRAALALKPDTQEGRG